MMTLTRWGRRLPALGLAALILGMTVIPAAAQDDPAAPAQAPAAAEPADEGEASGLDAFTDGMDRVFGKINEYISAVIFFDLGLGKLRANDPDTGEPYLDANGDPMVIAIPALVAFLVLGGVTFTIFHKFISIRGFRHSIQITAGKYDNPDDPGEISHFRALTSALSATVGLGNIAGVAAAISLGGPGAVFWMWVTAGFGMSLKFNSCTLSQLFRKTNADGSISGGPMYYLDIGIGERGGAFKVIGKVIALIFAVMIMGGALGGGNMFQANQSFEGVGDAFGFRDSTLAKYIYGAILAIMVALVIIGGIKRIGAATSKIVPAMCGIYIIGALVVVFMHLDAVFPAIKLIFSQAFSSRETMLYGGFIGVLVTGVQRAAFSNEAGLGSSAIAHAAAKTDEPVREGLVAMLEPFIDTIVVCTMTAIVVIVTGTYQNEEFAGLSGAAMTTEAFRTVIPWFPMVLAVCILLFAYSTMISWCYYGERGWMYIMDHFGEGVGLRTLIVFRAVFVIFVFIGAILPLGAVLDFSDNMILCLAFPNILGSFFLMGKMKAKLTDYWGRYSSGQMKTYK